MARLVRLFLLPGSCEVLLPEGEAAGRSRTFRPQQRLRRRLRPDDSAQNCYEEIRAVFRLVLGAA